MISASFDVPQAMMDIFYTHGAPEVILTDQGREFWNKVEYLHIQMCHLTVID